MKYWNEQPNCFYGITNIPKVPAFVYVDLTCHTFLFFTLIYSSNRRTDVSFQDVIAAALW